MSNQIVLDLPDDLYIQLQAAAHRKGRSINLLLLEWIEHNLSLEAVDNSPHASDIPLLAKEKHAAATPPQALLIPSNAGMRLIAQLTIYNKSDFSRLRDYITENYAPEALEFAAAKARLVEFKAIFRVSGKLRVDRVVAIDKHQALVVVEGERGDFYMVQLTVSEDYPHKILVCTFNKGAAG